MNLEKKITALEKQLGNYKPKEDIVDRQQIRASLEEELQALLDGKPIPQEQPRNTPKSALEQELENKMAILIKYNHHQTLEELQHEGNTCQNV